MRGFQQYGWCEARTTGFLPACGAKAPAIPGRKPDKAIFRARRGKIISRSLAELQKFSAHFRANHMKPDILGARIAAAIAEKPRQWCHGTGQQRPAQHIALAGLG